MGELVQDLSEMMSQIGAGAEGERGDGGGTEHRLVVVEGPHEADDEDSDEDEGPDSAGSSVRPAARPYKSEGWMLAGCFACHRPGACHGGRACMVTRLLGGLMRSLHTLWRAGSWHGCMSEAGLCAPRTLWGCPWL